MLVDRPGDASAVFGTVVAGRTAAAVINIAARPQDAIVREQSLEDCEFFMKVASGLYGLAPDTLDPVSVLPPPRTVNNPCRMSAASRTFSDAATFPQESLPERQRQNLKMRLIYP